MLCRQTQKLSGPKLKIVNKTMVFENDFDIRTSEHLSIQLSFHYFIKNYSTIF